MKNKDDAQDEEERGTTKARFNCWFEHFFLSLLLMKYVGLLLKNDSTDQGAIC